MANPVVHWEIGGRDLEKLGWFYGELFGWQPQPAGPDYRLVEASPPGIGGGLIEMEPHVDNRGYFARAFCSREFAARGLRPVIAQANVAFNHRRGTLRGMHFQYPPHAETKLVRATGTR